ncbi:hypothetical protein Golob_020983 [Gossypium lobatum]|uniref:SAWADEE domain-containing protein n=1 Tax=Gossypium lobatum TaxID=34289 RepID=A0A7J8LC91_9ROSI|nr:hypothetical protein [Gossypium lobatum]
MGRPPSNGGPAFRFTQTEVADMETVLQEHHNQMPAREILESLAEKFRRYAIRAKSSKVPGKLNVTSMPRDDSNPVRNVLQPVAAPMPPPAAAPMSTAMPATTGRMDFDSVFETDCSRFLCPVPVATRHMSESFMEFEAKSSRDGAWYDVATFLAHRYMETGDPEVQVRFAGFGPEEDEWVKVRKHLRQRSLPCEASECVAVLPGDLILCFQEGKDQALYFDAHVLDAQRRRHDVRGCRCRFLVRYDHDQSEEIVPLRKVCRRPETDYRLQQLHASSNTEQKPSTNPPTATTPAETMQKQQNRDVSRTPAPVGVSHANVSSIAAQTANPESKNAAFTTTIATSTPAQNMQE